jgi:hypothetical protein
MGNERNLLGLLLKLFQKIDVDISFYFSPANEEHIYCNHIANVRPSMRASILLHSCLLRLNLGYSKVKAEMRITIPCWTLRRRGTGDSSARPFICLTTVSTKRTMVTWSGPVCRSTLGSRNQFSEVAYCCTDRRWRSNECRYLTLVETLKAR